MKFRSFFLEPTKHIISSNSGENEKEKCAKILGQKKSRHASSISSFFNFFLPFCYMLTMLLSAFVSFLGFLFYFILCINATFPFIFFLNKKIKKKTGHNFCFNNLGVIAFLF